MQTTDKFIVCCVPYVAHNTHFVQSFANYNKKSRYNQRIQTATNNIFVINTSKLSNYKDCQPGGKAVGMWV